MKHSITNELYNLTQVINILEEGKEVTIEIQNISNSKCELLDSITFCFSKEQLHSFIGTLLHVQSKLRK
jgi:hypothetical protein